MSYNKRIKWKDHVVERPRTYNKVTNPDGSETLTPAPGEIIQQGTPQSATNFGKMEDGLQYVSVAYDLLMTTTQAQARAGGGGSNRNASMHSVLTVKCILGDEVTVHRGSTSFTKTLDDGEELTFDLPSCGKWTVETSDYKRVINCPYYGEYFIDISTTVFGIQKTANGSGTSWTRTDDSANFTVSTSVGTTPGKSDFDGKPIFGEIQRELIGDDVMVKIPRFYFQRTIDGDNIEHIRISNRQTDGFALHPAFCHNGENQECIYVGAYKTSSGHASKSGVAPLTNITRAAFRTGAAAKGTGWGIIDVSAVMAIQTLALVEFADNNLQNKIGQGYSNSSNTGAINTGSCDTVPNLTGRPSGNNDKVDVIWRGIEGIWGNVWEWFDGLNWNGGAYYICNDQNSYADDTSAGYTATSFSGGSTSWSKAFITAMGYDANNPAIMLPVTASGSESTYYCDAVWSGTGWRVARRGGVWDIAGAAGLFALSVSIASSDTNAFYGSRLLYIPS